MQEDLSELMLDAEEIQEVMGRTYGVSDTVDESELLDELAALEDEWEGESVPSTAVAAGAPMEDLPAAPVGAPVGVAPPRPGKAAVASGMFNFYTPFDYSGCQPL